MKKLASFINSQKLISIDCDAYLKRLGLVKEIPSFSFLKKLHKAHLLNIPFENLDIHYGQKIVLDYHKVFEKVIDRGRGGFCYELNGLFYQLLLNLGYKCHLISGRVKNKDTGEFGKEFDHMIIALFDKEDIWLIDVGFGEGFITPKKIDPSLIQMDYTRYWRISKDADENHLLQVSKDASHFENVYQFSLIPRQMIEFMGMCTYHQSSPDSFFTGRKLISQLTNEGRITLTDRSLKITSFAETKEFDILNEDEFLSKLKDHFGITFQQLIPIQ